MGLIDKVREKLLTWLMPDEYLDPAKRERLENYGIWSRYYQGEYRKQLRVRPMQADDNIGINFAGLIVDRSVSMLIGEGVDYDLGENEKAEEYLAEVYRANKESILFHKAAMNAAVYGTGYIKIVPGGAELRQSQEDVLVPRLVALDPRWVEVTTMEEDVETVQAYTIRYNVGQIAHREVTERQVTESGDTSSWLVTHYISNQATRGAWQVLDEYSWPYEYAPIIHWQNLPDPSGVYGVSDIAQVLELQDRANFIASNISKVIRYHAHPKTWGRNAGNSTQTTWGADEMVMFSSPDALIQNLEMQTDLASSRAFYTDLRQAMFDLSRTVDLTSISDKIGALTNFGLRVLYMDAIGKLKTKRELFGEAILELNHRLLSLANIEHDDGGVMIWHDPLPVNQTEQTAALQADLAMGIVAKETVSKKRGYDWKQEQELLTDERGGEENLGSMLLQAFTKGQ